MGITAARRAPEQASLCRSLGLEPVVGPCIDVDRPVDDARLVAPIEEAVARPIDLAVFMTGIGARHVLGAAARHGLEARLAERLADATVVARGAKARNALRRLGVRVDHVADPPETAGIVALLEDMRLRGARALVLAAGPNPDEIGHILTGMGATTVQVHPYDIAAPPDDLPGVELVRAAARGGLAAVTFTSAHAVIGFAALAERAGVELDEVAAAGTMMASVGPVTTASLRDHGLPVGLEPETPRMGALYQALARTLTDAGVPPTA